MGMYSICLAYPTFCARRNIWDKTPEKRVKSHDFNHWRCRWIFWCWNMHGKTTEKIHCQYICQYAKSAVACKPIFISGKDHWLITRLIWHSLVLYSSVYMCVVNPCVCAVCCTKVRYILADVILVNHSLNHCFWGCFESIWFWTVIAC